MGRIWNNVKEVTNWAKRPLINFLGHPVVNRGLEHMGRIGKVISGVSHLANLYYWVKDGDVGWRNGDWGQKKFEGVQRNRREDRELGEWQRNRPQREAEAARNAEAERIARAERFKGHSPDFSVPPANIT